MRKALIVGINYYEHQKKLTGCVNDAYSIKPLLDRHENGTSNFDTHLKTATDKDSQIDKSDLKHLVRELFNGDSEIALFYFAGHGHIEDTGGYLMTSECRNGDDGLPMNELLDIVNASNARNKIVILDCCHSGAMGSPNVTGNKALIEKGTTILAASRHDQFAAENTETESGVFTTLLVDALSGGASSLLGDITPGGVYAHIDQSLGYWKQRPIFKTNIEYFITLRTATPSIPLADLHNITTLFEDKGMLFKLDPTYEPERSGNETDIPLPVKENTEKFAVLQKYNRVNLVVPDDAPHMYHAAMNSKGCKLTLLGQHYWNLVKENRI